MDESGPVDSVGPWTIKAVARNVRESFTQAAKREGLTVGQWLERRQRQWIEDGSPVVIPGGPPRSDSGHPALSDAERIAASLCAMAAVGLPVPKRHAAQVSRALVRMLDAPAVTTPPPMLSGP